MHEKLTLQAKDEGFGFTIDLPYGQLHISSDEAFGFRPYQLLVSSVAACSGSVMRKILHKKRINLSDLRVVSEVTRSEQGAQEIESIHLHFDIYGAEISKEQFEKVLVLTRKNCSMVQSVQEGIKITESYTLHP